MKQAIEYRRGEDFIACEQFSPFAHGFVGRDQERPASVAVGDEPEEQARILAVHGLEAELVDDQQCGGQVFSATQLGRREQRVAAIVRRGSVVDILGNLTILNAEINQEIKNHAWNVKREAILEATQLRMNYDIAQEPAWDEDRILERGRNLGAALCEVFRGPPVMTQRFRHTFFRPLAPVTRSEAASRGPPAPAAGGRLRSAA